MQGLHRIGEGHVLKVAIINRKGGTGKTTVTANLGGELARRGYLVGLVDSDAQGGGHLGVCLGMLLGDARNNSLYAAMTGRRGIVERARTLPQSTFAPPMQGHDLDMDGALVYVAGGDKTYRIPDEVDDADLFGRLLDEFAAGWGLNIILVDTGPSMGKFDGALYDAMDAFLYVTQAETLANIGIAESFAEIARRNQRRLARGQRATKVLGIQPNQVGRLREHTLNLNELGKWYGKLVWQPIRRLNVFAQMAAHGQIVSAYAPGGPEAEMMRVMTDRFEQEVATWLTSAE